MARNFHEMLEAQWDKGNFVCVGLDNSDLCRMQMIIQDTGDLVCAYKLNLWFYLSKGVEGLVTLKKIVRTIWAHCPDVPVILDFKSADIASTNLQAAEFAFEYLGVDAVTVNPYLGGEALKPFLDYTDKGIFVLCRTSNPGAGEFQDLPIHMEGDPDVLYDYTEHQVPLYQIVARRVTRSWNYNKNCALVVGATAPEELREVRKIVGDMPMLIPGIGAQGGDLEKTVAAGKDSRGRGMIINSSRGIIFAEDPRAETIKLRDAINQYREGEKS